MDQNHTYCQWNASKPGQNVLGGYFVLRKLLDQEKSMKTLFSEFFNLFPIMPNLTVWTQVNFKCFAKF